MHYQRRRILGDVGEAAPRFMQKATVAERFWAKVDKDGPVPFRSDLGPCWQWTASHFISGYGALGVNGKLRGAHVVAYEVVRGPIPEGLELDHLCHTTDPTCVGMRCSHRGCCNPDHLEVVTKGENTRRGNSPGMIIRRSGFCAAGHDMTDPANQKPGSKGRVICRTCANLRRMERYWRLGR